MAALSGSLKLALSLFMLAAAALTSGCDEKDTVTNGVASIKLAGKTYFLEIAADDDTRMLGLGGRTQIADDGGMIFAFPASKVMVQSFVMRDCPIDIDIIYTDGAGRILSMHEMKTEVARGEGDFAGESDQDYNDRLKRYSSRYPATFVIELKPGSIKSLGLKEGDVAVFDHAALKKMAQ